MRDFEFDAVAGDADRRTGCRVRSLL